LASAIVDHQRRAMQYFLSIFSAAQPPVQERQQMLLPLYKSSPHSSVCRLRRR